MRQKWLAGDGHERFGNFFRDGPQPRGESARENGDGNFERRAHEINELGALEIKTEADFLQARPGASPDAIWLCPRRKTSEIRRRPRR